MKKLLLKWLESNLEMVEINKLIFKLEKDIYGLEMKNEKLKDRIGYLESRINKLGDS